MLGIVRIALQRPYTFVVLALLLLIGPLAALRSPTDIFPEIRIPVINVVWQYTGLPPDLMAGRINTPCQRTLTQRAVAEHAIAALIGESPSAFALAPESDRCSQLSRSRAVADHRIDRAARGAGSRHAPAARERRADPRARRRMGQGRRAGSQEQGRRSEKSGKPRQTGR